MLSNAYQQWNDSLAERLFNPERAGQNVYLNITNDLIEEIESSMPGAGPFLDAVVGRSARYSAEGVCRRALHAFRYWRYRRDGLPPYIAYLSLFVLASDIDGEFAPHAYYPRLWQIVGEQRIGPVPSFNLMWQLWDDLEDWTVRDMQGELGIFQSRSVGGNLHIGYPLSQSILAGQDRRALPQVFSNAGLDPATIHVADELAMALRSTTARRLMRARAVRVASDPRDVLHKAMILAVSEELAVWDGRVTQSATYVGKASTFIGLRLCINIDSVMGIVNASLRCKLNREFPEEGFAIAGGFRADEDVNGWSLPLCLDETGERIDASNLDWRNGMTLQAESSYSQLKLPGRELRIFVSGLNEGISDLVETSTLPRGQPFYIAYPKYVWPRLERWVTKQCRAFRAVDIAQGLPSSWQIARIDEAIDDEAVRSVFPTLSFPSEVRLRLVGGIRSGSGNNFFNFAPPMIELLGGTQDTQVFCNDRLLPPSSDTNYFPLPTSILTGSRVILEARSGQATMQRQTLYLTGDFSLPKGEPTILLASSGIAAAAYDEGLLVAGAYTKGDSSVLTRSAAGIFYDLEHEIGRVRGFLVGENPGEIVAWPSEPFPEEWIPAWIIRRRRRKRWEVVFIGDILASMTFQPSSRPTIRKIRDWKQILWHRRKRTVSPRLPAERHLWLQLQELAHNV